MRQIGLKPLLGIAVVLGAIGGAANPALASSSQRHLNRASEAFSPFEDRQLEPQTNFQIAQFSPFPQNSDVRSRREDAARDAQRCLDKRNFHDREDCFNSLRNDRRDDRRNDRRELSREEKRCLEKRSYRDRESCLTNLRNDRRNDRYPFSQSYPRGLFRL